MACEKSLDLLEKKIIKLREDLDDQLEKDNSSLCSPEVLEINNRIDKLLVSYIKLTI